MPHAGKFSSSETHANVPYPHLTPVTAGKGFTTVFMKVRRNPVRGDLAQALVLYASLLPLLGLF